MKSIKRIGKKRRLPGIYRIIIRCVLGFLSIFFAMSYSSLQVLASEGETEKEERREGYAYTSNMRAFIGGFGYYGVIEIDGKYYLPLDMFSTNGYSSYQAFTCFQTNDGYRFIYDPANYVGYENVKQIAYKYRTCAGIELGLVTRSSDKLTLCKIINDITSDFHNTTIELENVIYLLEDIYPYVESTVFEALSDVKIYKKQNAMYLFYQERQQKQRRFERDLIGLALTKIITNPKEQEGCVYEIWTYLKEGDKSKSKIEEKVTNKIDNKTFYVSYNTILNTGYKTSEEYAIVFQAMCQRVGIPCLILCGMRGSEEVYWNYVYIDGIWSHITQEVNTLVSDEEMADTYWWAGFHYPYVNEEGEW